MFTRDRPSKAKLVDNAIPCILPGCPSYLSTRISKPTRLSYESEEQELFDEALKLSIAEQIAEEEMFKIIDFKDLTERLYTMTLPDNYIRSNSDSDTVYLLQLSGNGHNVSVALSIVISSSLGVRAFLKQSIGLLEEISNPDLTSEPESNSQSADEYSETFPQIARLKFILCQLENVTVHKKRRRYNVITQVVTLKSHLLFAIIIYNL